MLVLYRPSLRAAGAILVLLAWVASLAWLGFRRLGQSEETTLSNQATLRLAPGTVWYAVDAGGTQVGNAAVTLDTLSPGYRITEALVMATVPGDSVVRVTRRTEIVVGSTLNLERIRSRFSRGSRQADWDLTIANDTLAARFSSGTVSTMGHERFADPPTTAWVLPYRLALGGGLANGRERTVTAFDGWPSAGGPMKVTVGRDSLFHFVDSSRFDNSSGHWVAAHSDTARSYDVLVNSPAGPRRLWIDRRGAVSRLITPLGVTWERTDFDVSETEFRKNIVARTPGIRLALPTVRAFLQATDSGLAPRRFLVQHRDGSAIDTALLAFFAGGRQQVAGDTIVVMPDGSASADELARDTLADAAIQSETGAIDREERRLVQQPITHDRMPAFVAEFRQLFRLDSAMSASEDAMGTLHARAGRPDGIVRLFVALLRASNVPARFVIGVYPRGDTLYTHAWAEVWNSASGGWYAVDPVSGRAQANTGLIRLAFAGSSHPDEMLAMLANARLTDVSQKDAP